MRAGAQAVQLFDSWAGALGPRDFREFALPYLAKAARIARDAGAPVIAFSAGRRVGPGGDRDVTGADVIGVDWQTERARRPAPAADLRVALQGNLDPCWLYATPAEIRERTHAHARGFRRAGTHRESGSRHSSGCAGGSRAGVRRGGEGMAGAVTAGPVSRLDDGAHRDSCTTRPPACFRARPAAATFAEDRWERPGGGGGVTPRPRARAPPSRRLGVNRSAVTGCCRPAEPSGWARARRMRSRLASS